MILKCAATVQKQSVLTKRLGLEWQVHVRRLKKENFTRGDFRYMFVRHVCHH